MATYGSNLLLNGSAESGMESFTTTGTPTTVLGGVEGTHAFKLGPGDRIAQTVNETVGREDYKLTGYYYLDPWPKGASSKTFGRVKVTIGSEVYFTDLVPLSSKAFRSMAGLLNGVATQWAIFEVIINPQVESYPGTSSFEIEFVNDSNDLTLYLDDLQFLPRSDLEIPDRSITEEKLAYLTITSAVIQDAAITTAKIADAAITTAKIEDATITNAKIDRATVNKLQVVTADIVDANITTAKIALAAIDEARIKDAAINTAKIMDLAVTSAKIANAAIGSAQIDDLAVTGAKIAAATITNANIATATITSANIELAAITEALIADAAIGTAKIQDLAVGTAQISDAAITNAKINDLAVDSAKIAVAAITTAKIDDAAITTAKIGDAQITNAKIDRASVNKLQIITADIVDGNITNAKIGNLAVTAAKIADATITSAKIGDAQITTAKIATGAITTALIGDGQITTAKIGDAQITDAKIGTLTAGKLTSGTIDTAKITIQGANGKLKIAGNRLQVFDNQATPKERVALGDVNADGTIYGFRVRGADGTTVLYDHTGVFEEGITDGAVTNPKIGDDAVDGRIIAADAVTAEHILANTITATEIASKTITAAQMVAGTITAASGIIADAAITAAKIADAAITTAKIADAAITNAKIDSLNGNKIVANSITTTQMNVLAKNLVNNWTVSGTTEGWTNGQVPNSLSDAELVVDAERGKVLRTFPATRRYYFSDRFEIDPTQDYKLTLGVKVPVNLEKVYFGIEVYDENGVEIGVDTWNGVYNNNFYFWYSDTASNITEWRDMVGYVMGCNSDSTKDVPKTKNVLPVTAGATYAGAARFHPKARYLQVRFLHYMDGGEAFWYSPSVTAVGGGSISANQIEANTITANEMKVGTITAASGILADAAITNAKIANATIENAKIKDLTITGAKISDATLTGAKLVDATIGTAKIANAAITTAKIGDAQITNAKIASLDASKINTGYLNAARINVKDYLGTNLSIVENDVEGWMVPEVINGETWYKYSIINYQCKLVDDTEPTANNRPAPQEGDEVVVKFEALIPDATVTEPNLNLMWTVRDASNTIIYSKTEGLANLYTINKGTTPTKIDHVYKIPNGAYAGKTPHTWSLDIVTSSSNGRLRVRNADVRFRVRGSLIVQGDIEAKNITAWEGLNVNNQFKVDANGNVSFAGTLVAGTAINSPNITAGNINGANITLTGLSAYLLCRDASTNTEYEVELEDGGLRQTRYTTPGSTTSYIYSELAQGAMSALRSPDLIAKKRDTYYEYSDLPYEYGYYPKGARITPGVVESMWADMSAVEPYTLPDIDGNPYDSSHARPLYLLTDRLGIGDSGNATTNGALILDIRGARGNPFEAMITAQQGMHFRLETPMEDVNWIEFHDNVKMHGGIDITDDSDSLRFLGATHNYMEWDIGAHGLMRSAYFGFAASGTSHMTWRNEVNGGAIILDTTGTGLASLTLYGDASGSATKFGAIYNDTTSSAANMHINSSGYVYRSSSARKYKLDEEVIPIEDAKKILQLQPKTWFDRRTVEIYADLLTKEDNGEEVEWEHVGLSKIRRIPGLVAEDLIDAGLSQFVMFEPNDEGIEEPEEVMYDRLPGLLIPLIKELYAKVEELERKLVVNGIA